jgi:peptide/nickel transport system substrate-binding protein
MRTPLGLAGLVLLASACQHADRPKSAGNYGGTMVISSAGDADAFFPPTTSNPTSWQVDGQVFEHLAEPGAKLNTIGDAGWTGRLAKSWSWAPDSLSIAFHLDPRAHWHDGPPVRSNDVRFTYQLYMDPQVGSNVAPLLGNIDSVTTPDSLTAVFWFKHRSPQQFFDASYQMRILPEHVLAGIKRSELQTSEFVRHPIGSGPYRFVRWVPRQSVELSADTTYHLGRPHLDRLIWSIAPDPNAALVRVLSGEADFVEYLRPADLAQVAKHPSLKVVQYPSMAYAYLLFNERDPKNPARPHPLFGDREVRRALTMAVDRRQLVKSVFDSLAAVPIGPITRAMPSYDSTLAQLPYAPDSARKVLDADGWHVGPNGIRQKNGQPLHFTIIVPTSSTPRVQSAVLLQQMFKAVGADAEIEQMDFATHSQRTEARRFDASMYAFMSDGSPSTIRQTWSVAAVKAKDGSNYGSYQNPRFDALIDTAAMQMDPARADAYYRRAYEMMNQDAPAIWLYEPITFAAVQKRIDPVDLRADAWWANLDRWSIPESEQIARDRIGFADARP